MCKTSKVFSYRRLFLWIREIFAVDSLFYAYEPILIKSKKLTDFSTVL